MFIDIVYALLLVLAIYKGYSKGFIVAVFSVLALFIGLAAALKLSAVVAGYLAHGSENPSKWIPFVSFVLVLLAVLLLVRLLSSFTQKTFEHLQLGWINRLAGMALYMLIYSFFFSILIFYLRQLKVVTDENTSASVTYPYLKSFGPIAMEWLGKIIPFFKNSFEQLKEFFGKVASKA